MSSIRKEDWGPKEEFKHINIFMGVGGCQRTYHQDSEEIVSTLTPTTTHSSPSRHADSPPLPSPLLHLWQNHTIQTFPLSVRETAIYTFTEQQTQHQFNDIRRERNKEQSVYNVYTYILNTQQERLCCQFSLLRSS